MLAEYSVYAYGARQCHLTGNKKQSEVKFFDSVCEILGTRHYLSTAYHPLTNRRAERLGKAVVQRLRKNGADHQTYLEQYLQPLAYSFNAQVYKKTRPTPFDVVWTQKSPSTTVLGASDRLGTAVFVSEMLV